MFEGTGRAMLVDTGFGTLPLGEMAAFQSSLKRIMAMADTFDTVWPSHGGYPLKPDIIPDILRGTQDLLDGKLPGQEPPRLCPARNTPAAR